MRFIYFLFQCIHLYDGIKKNIFNKEKRRTLNMNIWLCHTKTSVIDYNRLTQHFKEEFKYLIIGVNLDIFIQINKIHLYFYSSKHYFLLTLG